MVSHLENARRLLKVGKELARAEQRWNEKVNIFLTGNPLLIKLIAKIKENVVSIFEILLGSLSKISLLTNAAVVANNPTLHFLSSDIVVGAVPGRKFLQVNKRRKKFLRWILVEKKMFDVGSFRGEKSD